MPPQKPNLPDNVPSEYRPVLDANMEWHLDAKGNYPNPHMIQQWVALARDAETRGIPPHTLDKDIMKTMGFTGWNMAMILGGKSDGKRTDDRRHRKSTKSHG